MATDVHGAVTTVRDTTRNPLAVRVQGLTRSFGGRPVIDRLDLDVRSGEFVALLGRSGCGKSTLLRILAGLDRDIDGTVLVPRRKAVAFQAPRLMPWKRVWRNVVLGLPGRPPRARAERALEEVGLGHRAQAWPKTLSGGEAQRASLARALVREPDLLLLDEPFGALDALTRITAQRLVGELWQRRGCAVLLVTHDVEEAVLLADRVLVMDKGGIAHEVRVGLERPRDIADPRFARLRARLLELLGVSPAEAEGPDGPGGPDRTAGPDGPDGPGRSGRAAGPGGSGKSAGPGGCEGDGTAFRTTGSATAADDRGGADAPTGPPPASDPPRAEALSAPAGSATGRSA